MKVVSSKTVSGSYSDNRKSKTGAAFDKLRPRACRGEPRRSIQNPKWVGLALVIALTFALGGAVAQAQQATRVPRIGILIPTSESNLSARVEAFRQRLRELGYVEGKNIF